MRKKIIYIFALMTFGLTTIVGLANANENNDFFYDLGTTSKINNQGGTQMTEYGELIKKDAIEPEDSLLNNLMKIFKLDKKEYEGPQKAFYYIKRILNYGLSFVSFIALILLLYTFYQMLIGDGEKGLSKAKETLKGISIALAVMAIARLIVSMLFWIYQKQAYIP